jgi:alanine racemase
MPDYTLQKLTQFTNGSLLGNGDMRISRILIDSRKVFSPEETLFIALRGRNHDGHKYIEELYKKGVRAFVVERPPLAPPVEGGNYKKVLMGLFQNLKKFYR